MSFCKFVVFEKWTHAHLYQVALKIMLLSILIGNSVTDYLSVVHYSDFKIIKIYIIFFYFSHNLHEYCQFFAGIRLSIEEDNFEEFKRNFTESHHL